MPHPIERAPDPPWPEPVYRKPTRNPAAAPTALTTAVFAPRTRGDVLTAGLDGISENQATGGPGDGVRDATDRAGPVDRPCAGVVADRRVWRSPWRRAASPQTSGSPPAAVPATPSMPARGWPPPQPQGHRTDPTSPGTIPATIGPPAGHAVERTPDRSRPRSRPSRSDAPRGVSGSEPAREAMPRCRVPRRRCASAPWSIRLCRSSPGSGSTSRPPVLQHVGEINARRADAAGDVVGWLGDAIGWSVDAAGGAARAACGAVAGGR